MLGIDKIWDQLDPVNQHHIFLALKNKLIVDLIEETVETMRLNIAQLDAEDPRFVENYKVQQILLLQYLTLKKFIQDIEDPFPGIDQHELQYEEQKR